MREVAKRPLRPVWERKELYDLVISLRHSGLTYSQIIHKVLEERGVQIRKSHVSDWVNGKHKPYGSTHEFEPIPTPELAYVVGVTKGDGSISVQKWSYRIRLRVIDKEFIEEFDRCASAVVGSRRHSVKWLPKKGLWSVQVSSVLLYRFLSQRLSRLKKVISHCRRCAAAFLRGFFDSEGSMSGRSLTVSNTNIQVLRLVKNLMQSLKIQTTGPRLSRRGGRTVIIKGKQYRANKNQYVLYVRAMSLQRYARKVGFAVKRKQEALSLALA